MPSGRSGRTMNVAKEARVRVTFCGAAGTVTGSCHLVEVGGLRILLDCGLFQGHQDVETRNYAAFPFAPREIDFVVLSHAHLDHAGLLPRLVREGFRGDVISTPPTAEIARAVLMDAAHVQAEDAQYRARKAKRRGEEVFPPLYDVGDVLDTLDTFRRRIPYEERVSLKDGTEVVLHDAGHILGSASVELRGEGKTLVYSGDLGNAHRPLVRSASPPPRADVVLVESTYGDRRHRSLDESVTEMQSLAKTVLGRGGNLLIPSFALERTQEVLYELFTLWQHGELPECRVFLDSPLGIATTRIFARYPDYFDAAGREVFSRKPNPFVFPPLRYTQTTEESRQINALAGGAIILAGSGMCTGGRILHHLRHNLWREECGVLFVGYQADGTLGRSLVDGARRVNVLGEETAVRATVSTVNGFSAHADQPALVAWLKQAAAPEIYLVHGEKTSSDGLKKAIQREMSGEVHLAAWQETVVV